LAAAERRFDTKKAGGNVYVEIETAFIDSAGRETQRKVIAYEQGKISVIQSALSPPHLEKPPFGTFAALYNSKFKSAETLDANKLGYCYFNLADGYPTVTRVVNFAPQPLDFYQQSSRTMNLQRFDYVWVTREPKKGVAQDLGTLDGKRVYSINYPGGDFHVIVVERQSGRYLPLMYFSPQTTIARLAILPSVGRQILAYSSAIAGNGGFTDDWYFILDQGIPKRVEFQPILVAELQKIYPEIKGTRPRGNFDLSGIRRFDVANLTFTSPVWKDDDANDSPSEKVQVVFQIRNGELVVKSSHREKSTGLF